MSLLGVSERFCSVWAEQVESEEGYAPEEDSGLEASLHFGKSRRDRLHGIQATRLSSLLQKREKTENERNTQKWISSRNMD